MSFDIIPMTQASVPKVTAQVAEIWHNGWHDGHAQIVPAALTALRTLDSFTERTLEHAEHTMVAVDGDRILGFTMTHGNELYQMYAASAARGAGVAQALIQDVETRVEANGHNDIWLVCAIGNTRAARFYEKCGWLCASEGVHELDTKIGKFPLNLWRFEKLLS